MKSMANIASLFFLFFSLISYGQLKDTTYQIGITTGAFTPEIYSGEKLTIKSSDTFDNTYFKILQFYSIPSEATRKEWEKKGLTLTDYLPGHAYFATIHVNFDLNQIQSLIRSIISVDSKFKLEESVYFKGIPPYAIEGNDVQLVISYYKGLNLDKIFLALTKKKIKIIALHEAVNQVDVLVESRRLNELVTIPFVQFISAMPAEPVPEAYAYDYQNTNARSNYLNSGYNGLNYNGSGITLAVGESGTLIDEIDAKGRMILEQDSGGPSAHKTSVMKSMAGAGNWDVSNRNQSWGSRIVSASANADYAALFNSHQVLYTNHSFGYGVGGSYNLSARNHDLLLSTYPKHLVSYSSGNDGVSTGYAPFVIANWANITGAVKMSKNMVTVGGLSEIDVKALSSSNGPMYDGRIAPQIVMEGAEGTSLASPKFIGSLGILVQAYKAQHADEIPDSSLLRAIIFNTADDLENPGPDFKTGFGRTNLRRAYDLMTQNQFLSSNISNQQTKQHTIVIPPNTKQLRAIIIWPDTAAAINANPAIVNDLDIVLKDSFNNTYNPWVLDTSLPSSEMKLNAPAVRGTDHINTIEQVTVDNPNSGNWIIEISGFNVPSGPQSYFIAYEFVKDEVKFMYPLQGDRISSKEEYQLKWDSLGDAGTFTLEYQLDDEPWIIIVAGHETSSRNYSWMAPVVDGVRRIKFRVKRGNLISESGINYIGPQVENFRIQKVCSNQVTLKWSPVNGATSYKIYRLGAKYMEEVTSNITFSGNTAVLTGQTTGREYYTVSPLTGTLEGRKVLTIAKEAGDYHCQEVQWTGNISTDWFDVENWASGSLPTAITNIRIPASAPHHPLIASSNAVCSSVTIDQGASLSMDTNSTFTMSVRGDWFNNGTFNSGIGIVDFANTDVYQEISGDSKTDFYILKMTKGSTDMILEANSLIGLKAASDPLVMTSGTFKLSSASTIRPFTTAGGAQLDGIRSLWINGGTVNYDNITWWYLNGGVLKISGGIVNMGTNSNVSIDYLNNGTLIIEGGTLNLNGSFSPDTSTSSGTYSQSGGILNLKSTTWYPFDLNPNTSFIMKGGVIRIAKRTTHPNYDMRIMSETKSIVYGTIQIGDDTTPVNQVIRINSTVPFYNLVVHSYNNPTAQILNDHFTIINNVNINGGNLDANGFNINVGGHWTNNASFTSNAGKVTFNGSFGQNLSGTMPTTFYNMELKNSNGINMNGSVNAIIDKVLNLASGVINTGGNMVSIGAAGSVQRISGHVFGKLQKTIMTGSNISTVFEIGDAVTENYTPVNLEFSFVTASGLFTVQTVNTDHPFISSTNLDVAKSINRHWILRNSETLFTNYKATFYFLSDDLDPLVQWNNLLGGLFNVSVWTYPNIGVKTLNSIQMINVNSVGDFQFAEGSSFLNVDKANFNNNDVMLYPNPVADQLYFSTLKTIEKIEIYTVTGNRISSIDRPQNSISFKGLSQGVYLLKIHIDNNKKIVIKKVIKK